MPIGDLGGQGQARLHRAQGGALGPPDLSRDVGGDQRAPAAVEGEPVGQRQDVPGPGGEPPPRVRRIIHRDPVQAGSDGRLDHVDLGAVRGHGDPVGLPHPRPGGVDAPVRGDAADGPGAQGGGVHGAVGREGDPVDPAQTRGVRAHRAGIRIHQQQLRDRQEAAGEGVREVVARADEQPAVAPDHDPAIGPDVPGERDGGAARGVDAIDPAGVVRGGEHPPASVHGDRLGPVGDAGHLDGRLGTGGVTGRCRLGGGGREGTRQRGEQRRGHGHPAPAAARPRAASERADRHRRSPSVIGHAARRSIGRGAGPHHPRPRPAPQSWPEAAGGRAPGPEPGPAP